MSRPLPATYIPIRESWEIEASYSWEHAFRCGAAHEAELIAKWLRDEETWRRVARGNLADAIERGEHLGGDDVR